MPWPGRRYASGELAEVVARSVGVGGRTEAWLLEAARRELGLYADALGLDQRGVGAKAMRLQGWAIMDQAISGLRSVTGWTNACSLTGYRPSAPCGKLRWSHGSVSSIAWITRSRIAGGGPMDSAP